MKNFAFIFRLILAVLYFHQCLSQDAVLSEETFRFYNSLFNCFDSQTLTAGLKHKALEKHEKDSITEQFHRNTSVSPCYYADINHGYDAMKAIMTELRIVILRITRNRRCVCFVGMRRTTREKKLYPIMKVKMRKLHQTNMSNDSNVPDDLFSFTEKIYVTDEPSGGSGLLSLLGKVGAAITLLVVIFEVSIACRKKSRRKSGKSKNKETKQSKESKEFNNELEDFPAAQEGEEESLLQKKVSFLSVDSALSRTSGTSATGTQNSNTSLLDENNIHNGNADELQQIN